MSQPLTIAAIRSIQPGQTLWDHVVTGLHVRRQAQRVTYNVYYRAHSGARRTLKLGNHPQLTLELARDAAREILRKVAAGDDPSQAKQETRAAPTVNELCDEWTERKKPPIKKERSYKEDLYNIANHVRPRLGKLRVAEVTSKQVADAITAIENGWNEETKGGKIVRRGGSSAARTVRTLVSGLFTLAEHSELAWRPRGTNPVQDVAEPPEPKRRVFIRPEQFERLAQELENLRAGWPWHVSCIWVALYCGTRITELATAKRDQVHGSLLILDTHKTDATGEERLIRLTAPARDELDKLPEQGPYLFGDLGAMGDGARRSIHYVFDLARTAAGCPEIRPQDLRRTFASVAKSRGVSLSQIGELFSHGNAQTTMRYAWLYDDAAQATADSVANAIGDMAKPRAEDQA